jgi:hypothetical protein
MKLILEIHRSLHYVLINIGGLCGTLTYFEGATLKREREFTVSDVNCATIVHLGGATPNR